MRKKRTEWLHGTPFHQRVAIKKASTKPLVWYSLKTGDAETIAEEPQNSDYSHPDIIAPNIAPIAPGVVLLGAEQDVGGSAYFEKAIAHSFVDLEKAMAAWTIEYSCPAYYTPALEEESNPLLPLFSKTFEYSLLPLCWKNRSKRFFHGKEILPLFTKFLTVS